MINYAPIEGSKEAEEHYDNLTNLTNSIPKHQMIIECRDFNAHLGTDQYNIPFMKKQIIVTVDY